MRINFTPAKIFLFSNIVFVIGIFVASFLSEKIILKNLWWMIGAVIFFVLTIVFWKKYNSNEGVACEYRFQGNDKKYLGYINIEGEVREPRLQWGIAFLFLTIVFLSFWRYSLSILTSDYGKIQHFNGQKVVFRGVVNKAPSVGEDSQSLELKIEEFSSGYPELSSKTKGKVLLTAGLYPRYNYGDILEVECKIEAPKNFSGFAYDKYLSRYDIYSVCSFPKKVAKIGEVKNLLIIIERGLFSFRNILSERISAGMAEPEAGVVNAIALGVKRTFSNDLKMIFSQAGISHAIAISGMHISLIAAMIMFLLLQAGFRRQKVFWLSSVVLLAYVLMIGAPPSANRSLFMGFMIMFGVYLGRLSRLENPLFFSAAVLLIINPKLLRYDIGFQLSYLAVFSIIYIFPILKKYTDRFIRKYKKLNNKIIKASFDIINITLAVQIISWPILIYNFSQISLISPVVNLLILWPIPFLLASVFGALAASFVLPALAVFLFLPAYLAMKYIIFVSAVFVKVPYAFITINNFPVWAGIIYYLIIFVLVLRYNHEQTLQNNYYRQSAGSEFSQ